MIAENAPEDEDLRMMTAQDISRYLRISTRQVWRLNKKKLLPAPVRFGERIIRWNAGEVADWLRSGSPPRSEWEIRRATQTVSNENA